MPAAPSNWSSSSTLSTSSTLQPQPQEPPQPRDVARPVANLGNTCYINAVLQALAHSPELCMAMDCEPHRSRCPVYLANLQAQQQQQQSLQSQGGRLSPSSSPDQTLDAPFMPPLRVGHRKSRRKRSPSSHHQGENHSSSANNHTTSNANNSSNNTTTSNGNAASSSSGSTTPTFCALCSVEEHLGHVHSKRRTTVVADNNDPVAPVTFVHGFIDHVAPWFKLGVQEDSHEFLRLLIDAMQKSCQQARKPSGVTSTTTTTNNSDNKDTVDDEYPFSLFRGTVESNVTCDSCRHSSSTLDPIEDIGLEVTRCTPCMTSDNHVNGSNNNNNNHRTHNMSHTNTASSSHNNNNIHQQQQHPSQLADVSTAFQRFARVEELDAGYKCDKCGKLGRATKQSRLASIPPILTLHLKRFRYGEAKFSSAASNVRSRTGRNEVSQLLTSAGKTSTNGDFYYYYSQHAGKSGSAKIEGHVKFEEIFDLVPYLTPALQQEHSNMMCRLFAVVVHTGKSSHSGHYIAYVRHFSKNEWWKMDDGRVMLVRKEEVMNAEAYMLFYRVVEHPIAAQLRMKHAALGNQNNNSNQLVTSKPATPSVAPDNVVKVGSTAPKEERLTVTTTSTDATADTTAAALTTPPATTDGGSSSALTTLRKNNKRKTSSSSPFANAEEWARAKTRLPPHMIGLLARAEEFVADAIDFKVEFSERLRAEVTNSNGNNDVLVVNTNNNKNNNNPTSCSLEVCEDDIKGGSDKVRRALLEFFFKLTQQIEKEGGDPNLLFDIRKHVLAPNKKLMMMTSKEKKFVVAPLVDATDDNYL